MAQEKILIVEDEVIVAMDIQRGLKRLGYQPIGIANNALDVISKLEEVSADLVLMDIQIQGALDGIETAKQIWTKFRLPVVFLTAYADKATLARAKSADSFGYVLKPFEDRELHTAIEVALSKHRSIEIEHRGQVEALHASQEQFKLFIDVVKDYAIYMINPDGIVISWNSGAERITGYQSAEVIGKHFSLFYTQEDFSKNQMNLEMCMAVSRGTFREEGWRVRKDGSRFWANIVITALKDASGKLKGFGKVVEDLTERKQREEELLATTEALRNAIRARDEFISIASHELKTPITSMKLQTQGIERSIRIKGLASVGSARLSKAFDLSTQQLNRLTRLVDDMLEISRIGSGKLKIQKTELDLGQLIEEIINRYSDQFMATNIVPHLNIQPNVMGHWDRFRLEQVILNLISNVIKYAPNQPVEVSVWSELNRAYIKIKDYGRGISKDAQKRIFNQFERDVSVSNISGLGLGLYIVKHIINSHDGNIRVTSDLGQGAEFIIDLPLGTLANVSKGALKHG